MRDVTKAPNGLVHAQIDPFKMPDPASDSLHADCVTIASALIWDDPMGIHFTTAARILISGVIAALARNRS